MQYTLGIAFLYYKYLRNATIRIFSDGALVDEITLSEDIGLRCVNLGDRVANLKEKFDGTHGFPQDIDEEIKWYEFRNSTDVIFLPKKIFLYNLDQKFLTTNIVIQCENPNTNYTNGFMTRFSHVRFSRIFLCPTHLMNKKKYLQIFRKNKSLVKRSFDKWPTLGEGFKLEASLAMTKKNYSKPPTKRLFSHPRTLYNYTIGGNFVLTVPLSQRDGYVCMSNSYSINHPGVDEKMFDLIKAIGL